MVFYHFRISFISKVIEHGVTFTLINTKVLVWGTVLTMILLYACPLCGLGEYSIYRG